MRYLSANSYSDLFNFRTSPFSFVSGLSFIRSRWFSWVADVANSTRLTSFMSLSVFALHCYRWLICRIWSSFRRQRRAMFTSRRYIFATTPLPNRGIRFFSFLHSGSAIPSLSIAPRCSRMGVKSQSSLAGDCSYAIANRHPLLCG